MKKSILYVFIISMIASCRPPSMEDQWQRNPTVSRDQEMPGQKPVGLDFEKIHDDRPEYVKSQDNPDYDPNSNLWDTMFGGWGSDAPSTPYGPKTVEVPPPPKPEIYDQYDINNGNIDATSGLFPRDDPGMAGIKGDVDETRNGFAASPTLLGQRDYAKKRSQELIAEFSKKRLGPFSDDVNKRFQKLNEDIDKAIASHNSKVEGVIAKMPSNENLPAAPGYEFKTVASSPNGQKVRSAQEYVNYVRGIVAKQQGIAGERARGLVEYAQNAVQAADGYYSEGRQAEGDFALEIAKTALDVGLSVIPGVGWAKDVAEVVSGVNVVTGEKLSTFERVMAGVGAATGGLGSKLAVVAKLGVVAHIARMGSKEATAISEITEVAGKAERFIEEAASLKRFGPLEEGPLHLLKEGSATVADTFRSSSYFEVVAKQDTKLYRVYTAGEEGKALGSYWSKIKPSGPLQAQLDSALDPSWGSKATAWVEVNLPAGTKFYDGAVSPVLLKSAESKIPIGQLYGGGSQVYLNGIRIPETWITAKGLF